ncbi:MAG TPA: response regulator transcription factor, partial [Actinobacteria bacterium]|nr:response regulator transcription factor [Actinomycetota bacterium]
VAGRSAIDPDLTATVCAHLRGELQEDPRLSGLNERERRILDLMAKGMTNRQIADDIYLAEKTVKNYVSGILRKLDMSTRTEAAAFMARTAAKRTPSAEQWQ